MSGGRRLAPAAGVPALAAERWGLPLVTWAALALFALASLALSGCAAPSRFRAASSPLERGIVLVEQDERGETIALSAPLPVAGSSEAESTLAAMGGEATAIAQSAVASRVPDPAQVDENSTIRIAIARAELQNALDGLTPSPDADAAREATALRQRLARLTSSLHALGAFVDAHARAFDAYSRLEALPDAALRSSPALSLFTEARRAYGRAQEALIDTLMTVWSETGPDGQEAWRRLESAVGELERDPIVLQAFLEGEMAGVRRALDLVERRVAAQGATLRLEAFLHAPGNDPIAIHLENYDLLEQGLLERHDRWGLMLTAGEQAELASLASASRELAFAAESVRHDETVLATAFGSASSAAVRRIGQIVVTSDSLLAQLEASSLRERLAALQTGVRALGMQVADTVVARGQTELRAEATALVEAVPDLAEQTQAWQQAITLLASLPPLLGAGGGSGGSPGGGPAALVQWVTSARAVASGIDDLADALDQAELAMMGLSEYLATRLQLLGEQTGADIAALWAASEAKRELDGLVGLAHGLRAAGVRLWPLVTGFQGTPLTTAIEVPEALDVPLDDVRDTSIDLWRTPRRVGHAVTLRATLKQDGRVLDQSMASFLVRRFGWHAHLAPSVVVVRPDRAPAASDRARFEASLSWLIGYTPRPEERGGLAGLADLLEPSLGPHAVFLNFDQADLDQIGLGFTLGLRRGLIQAGLGWNVLADSEDAASRLYTFIGSSLFPLLQSLGVSGTE